MSIELVPGTRYPAICPHCGCRRHRHDDLRVISCQCISAHWLELPHDTVSEEKTNVVVHPVTAKKVARDICPKCGGELDTGWECNDCGFDAIGFVELDPLGRPR
jgi:hypothetical protein